MIKNSFRNLYKEIENIEEEIVSTEEKLKKTIDESDRLAHNAKKEVREWLSLEQEFMQEIKLEDDELRRKKLLSKLTIIEENVNKIYSLINKMVDAKEEVSNDFYNEKRKFIRNLENRKKILNKSIEIQKFGIALYSMAIIYFITGIFTVFQYDRFIPFIRMVGDIPIIIKCYIFFAFILVIEGNIIYNRSINNAGKFIESGGKISIWKLLKFPNISEIILIFIMFSLLFITNVFALIMESSWGMGILVILNSHFFAFLFLQINEITIYMFREYTRHIQDPKDRLTGIVAIVGTVISLIALFK